MKEEAFESGWEENRSIPSPVLKSMVDQKTTGVKAGSGFYPRTDERIERVIHQRDEASWKIIEVIMGLNRGNRK